MGGEILVRAAVQLARHARITPAVIGLTVVAIGTSLPELVVSVAASTEGRGDLAIANVLGSNILNITATIGLAALITPLPARTSLVRLEWPVLLLASVAALLTMRDGVIDRQEAGFLLLGLIVFTVYAVRVAHAEESARQEAESAANAASPTSEWGLLASIGALALGLTLLLVGGESLVSGAVALASASGVSERVIGLTIVAIGTGAPEIAASAMAALRGQPDLAIGNVIGSNIFNVLGILGVAALWRPVGFDAVSATVDGWWMVGTVVLLLPVILIGRRVTRPEGALLIIVYAAYLFTVLNA